MSAGTGTSLVASRPTSVIGTSSASTAAIASGSAPTFHSTPSAGVVSPRSMLPGASIVPAIAWMPARREANDGVERRGVGDVRERAERQQRERLGALGRQADEQLGRGLPRAVSPSTAGSSTP